MSCFENTAVIAKERPQRGQELPVVNLLLTVFYKRQMVSLRPVFLFLKANTRAFLVDHLKDLYVKTEAFIGQVMTLHREIKTHYKALHVCVLDSNLLVLYLFEK